MLYRHTTKMEQMLEQMLAKMGSFHEEMKTNQAKMDTTLKDMKGELTTRLEAKIEAEIKTNI
jgi:hypothetical protein